MPFATLSRRGAQCAPRQRKIIRFVGEHSDSLRAVCGSCSLDAHCGGCVRPYGSAGADEFTNGVPRSYPRAPSLAALPQQSESTTERVGTRVAVRLWDCTSQLRQAHAQSESQTSAPVSSLDKTQAYVIMNTRDAVTAVRPLTDQQLKVIDRSGA